MPRANRTARSKIPPVNIKDARKGLEIVHALTYAARMHFFEPELFRDPLESLAMVGFSQSLLPINRVVTADDARVKTTKMSKDQTTGVDRYVTRILAEGKLDQKTFGALYKRFASAMPAPQPDTSLTLLSIGSSPEQLAFVHELKGNDVAYVSFSRAMMQDNLLTDAIFEGATKTALCKQLKASLLRAGVTESNLRDPSRKFVVADYMSTAGTFITLLELLGSCMKIDDLPARTTVIVLTDRKHDDNKPRLSRHAFTYKHVHVDFSFWVSPKVYARCIPRHSQNGPQPLASTDIAACNLVRLWLAKRAHSF